MAKAQALNSIEIVRKRPGMFIGDVHTPDHLAEEVLDNALDEVANGYATSINSTNTKLKITFNILPFIKTTGYYYILDIVSNIDNTNYLYVLVGGPNNDSLWILSHNICIPTNINDRFILKAKQLGYDTYRLVYDNYTRISYDNNNMCNPPM